MKTTRQVAKLLKVKETRLQDLLRRGKLPEPGWVGSRRVWTDEQIEAARPIVKQNGDHPVPVKS